MSLPEKAVLAAKAANLAENLPDGAAIIAAAVAASEEEHLADLLFRMIFCAMSLEDRYDYTGSGAFRQAVNYGSGRE